MEYRIKKYTQGFVIEVMRSNWYGKKYWVSYVTCGWGYPFFYTSYDEAEESLVNYIKHILAINSKYK